MAYYGDVRTAAAVFAANPTLANDTEALSNAASEGQNAFVRLMLRYQPDLAKRVAVGAKTRELTEYLFHNGMNPSQPDWLGVTPLHRFAMSGDVEKAALFIDHGADLNARDEVLCSTPLGYAAKIRPDRHGEPAPDPRRKTDPARRSTVGHPASVGDPSRTCRRR